MSVGLSQIATEPTSMREPKPTGPLYSHKYNRPVCIQTSPIIGGMALGVPLQQVESERRSVAAAAADVAADAATEQRRDG